MTLDQVEAVESHRKDERVTARESTAATLLCPACCGSMRYASRALISPWVRERAGLDERQSDYLLCNSCGSGAFSLRYTDRQMQLLYGDYRGASYFALRHSWEPTYDRRLNDDFGASPSVISARINMLTRALASCLGPSATGLGTAVDVGGDRGQFIPPSIPRRVLVDVSGKSPVEGVVTVPDLRAAMELRPDFVMSCGVLEHVADPRAFVSAIVDLVPSDRELVVYLEVPSGVPDPQSRSVPALGLAVGALASRRASWWGWLDARSSRVRSAKGRESRLMPLRQSEHLTFFSAEGLNRLVGSLGGEVLLLDEVPMPSELLRGGRLGFSTVLRVLFRIEGRRSERGSQ